MENDTPAATPQPREATSKSQLKRESQDIQKLGKRLTKLSPQQLRCLSLDAPVLEAIALAHKIHNKRSALKRHLQHLGKLLRTRDTAAISAALQGFDRSSQIEIQRHRHAEHWRDRILAEGFEAIELFISQQPHADRQRLRQLWRNYNSAQTDVKKQHIARPIYQDIKQALSHSSN